MSWDDFSPSYSFASRGSSTRSKHGKKHARQLRGARIACTCGAQTFENHLSAHLSGGKHAQRLRARTGK